MKIGIIGAGSLGTALAKRLVPQGHQVMLSFSRDAAKLDETAKALGAESGTPADSARFGEVIALVTPWNAVETALGQAGPLDGKIVWDCTNALAPDMTGLQIGTTTSGGEIVQSLVPRARVVKGIPPFAELLHSDDPTVNGVPAGCFLCGDDEDAKAIVRSLLAALPATVTDAGPLKNARYAEPIGFMAVQLAYTLGLGTRIAITVQK